MLRSVGSPTDGGPMHPRSRITVFFWGFALAVALGSAAAVGSGAVRPPFGQDEEGPVVLVVITADATRTKRLREQLPAERLLVDHPDGFALRGRRVVASNADAVGPILMSAGWRDARLDIFSADRMPSQRDRAAAADGMSDRIRSLINKPELSLLESRELLTWMDTQP